MVQAVQGAGRCCHLSKSAGRCRGHIGHCRSDWATQTSGFVHQCLIDGTHMHCGRLPGMLRGVGLHTCVPCMSWLSTLMCGVHAAWSRACPPPSSSDSTGSGGR
eukprot:11333857-Alexandrium_andersonii.AAC.1